MNVSIRPLEYRDAEISWKWRNDPDVWKLTGSKPNIYVTLEIEQKWITEVLARDNEYRFAICLEETGRYIGNAQLTDINGKEAQYHIFIGDKELWGKGIATLVTQKVLKYAFFELELNRIYSKIKPKNLASINMFKKCGFIVVSDSNDLLLLEINKI